MKITRDEAMIQLIIGRLGADLRTGGQTIQVHIENGEIVLIGNTDSEEQRLVAETIVRGMCGDYRVVNAVQVRRVRQYI